MIVLGTQGALEAIQTIFLNSGCGIESLRAAGLGAEPHGGHRTLFHPNYKLNLR